MALFSRFLRRLPTQPAPRVIGVERRKLRLPLYFRRLDVRCHDPMHVVHVRMRFEKFATSRDGQRLAIYACPQFACRCRQAWTQHRVTGEPFCLWLRSR